VTDAEKQNKVAVGYLLDPNIDSFEAFSLSFLCNILLDEPRGIFYQRLIESGFAPDFASATGFDSEISQLNFIVGVQGISKGNAENTEKIIQECFETISLDGVDQSLIDSMLHNYELSIKKVSHSNLTI
jgi:presequence protease